MTTQAITPATVRAYLNLGASTDSRYSDAVMYSAILGAIGFLEKECRRFFADRAFPVGGIPWAATTMIAPEVPIPGFRTFDAVTWGGAALTVALPGTASGGCWALPDNLATGVYTALQFRAFITADTPNWWYAHSDWFDQMYDSPWFPGNRGGMTGLTSMPNDLCIWGNAGYALGSEPYDYIDALTILSAYKVERPGSVLATVAMTPGGSTMKYGDLPGEVRDFIASHTIGQTAVQVG